MVFGLCAAHKEEEVLKLPNHDTNKDTSSSAIGTAHDISVSVRKQKWIFK